ncbi:putative protein phosphatase 2C 33-like [Capsicum annuum]|nr:putative protein phosphatase 2C 33-like [Capsicum annuum]
MLKIMDLRKKGCFILLLVLLVHVVGGNVVFNVEHKFGGRGKAVLRELKAHDVRRHGRMLAPEDFQLGGNGNPTGSGEKQPELKIHRFEGVHDCFKYSGKIDDGFPAVTFKFKGNLSLTAYPHDYLFETKNEWCFSWQDGGDVMKDDDATYLLGDMLLSNNLFQYDLEKKTIGWTQYDCSSNIKVKDETSGNVYTVGAHNISSASTMTFTFFFSLISFLCYLLLK